ncbi:MAG: PaaI family thioesterase [Candidatus Zophobacter franzmannii]|jgi:uncharacterized protein (TIGR00369 family)|nr:PaaI family thioesterase [Candidatus Zophobacter franzmannii]
MSEQEFSNCFACGADNPIGLHLEFQFIDGEAVAEWNCLEVFDGYPNLIHGGIISTLLDEAMAKILHFDGITAVTGKLNVSFRRPLNSGTMAKIVGKILENKGRVITTSAQIIVDDILIAEANAIYIRVGKK